MLENAAQPRVEVGRVDRSIPGLRIRASGDHKPWDLEVWSIRRQPWRIVPFGQSIEDLDDTPPALLYRGKAYLPREEVEVDDGWWLYRLGEWPTYEIIGRSQSLTREWFEREALERRRDRRMWLLIALSPVTEFLLGWLPRRVLETLGLRLHFSAEHAGRTNAMIEYVFGLVSYIVFMYAGAYGYLWLSAWCLVEGILRTAHMTIAGDPLGLVALEIVERGFLKSIDVLYQILSRFSVDGEAP